MHLKRFELLVACSVISFATAPGEAHAQAAVPADASPATNPQVPADRDVNGRAATKGTVYSNVRPFAMG